MSGETPKNVDLTTYHAICEKKFIDNDKAHRDIRKEIGGVRKLLWGLLASIVLMIFTFTISTVVTYANKQDRLNEIKAIVEEVVNGK